MRPTRSLPLAALALAAAVSVGLPAPAAAQNFFEELFGIGRAARPPVPPRGVPGGVPGGVPEGPQAPAGEPGAPAPEAARPPPAPPKPVVLKAPSEDSVLGQELQLNGLNGSLKLERAGAGLTAQMTLPGTKVSQPTETCSVPLGGGTPLTLTSEGKPEGVPRYQSGGEACPLQFDVTEGGVFVSGPPVCTFPAADCAATPQGLWGPAAATLLPRAGEFDGARGTADRAVRDNYKLLTQRARREDVRPIVSEQAAFSADREQLCRTYAREGAHGFCHLRATENRALALATRLGANTAVPTTAAITTRRARPKPAVDGANPDAAPLAE